MSPSSYTGDTSLFEVWASLLASLGVVRDVESSFADLQRRYSEPHRLYHTLDHIQAVLATIEQLHPAPNHALRLAGWLHDVIYNTCVNDSEARSAAHARTLLASLGVEAAIIEETARLILLTRTHDPAGEDGAGKVLIDADLAILAAPEEQYDHYAAAIRHEYGWVPALEFRRGRGEFLERFLSRPRIYRTETMYEACEQAARANVRRELARYR